MEHAQDTRPLIDLLVIGGGINGVGIARDAVGRGLSVTLVERGDLAGATSSSSSKLIHGGLRYLEQFELRLVAEALAEREILLRAAPHLVWPARFIMPHVPSLRPRWMIRTGLFLYDHLGRRQRRGVTLPGSHAVRLDTAPLNSGLNGAYRHGFAYSDCRTDDARLVIAVARDAARRGATILPRTEVVTAQRQGDEWQVALANGERLRARAIANVAGPWVKQVLNERLGVASADAVRLVRGSHIVLPRLYAGEHAFILQNTDRRVVFMIPYEGRFTLVGTTDVAQDRLALSPEPTADEVDYLCDAVGRYLARRPSPSDIVWQYAGVRPLYDDGSGDPSAVTRDYTLRIDAPRGAVDCAPVLSVFGGKLTTFRHLAEVAVDQLTKLLAHDGGAWTADAALPGADLPAGGLPALRTELAARYPWLDAPLLAALVRRHGSETFVLLGDARAPGDLGEHHGGGLFDIELAWFRRHEWAMHADDMMWRRSKCGLFMSADERARLKARLG